MVHQKSLSGSFNPSRGGPNAALASNNPINSRVSSTFRRRSPRFMVQGPSASAALPQIKGGKLKALAVTTPQRMNSLPQVPTVAEVAIPGFSYSLWGGLFAPADTPAAVVQSLNKEVNAIMSSPDIRTRFETDNLNVPRNTPAEFAEYVRSEAVKFEKLVKDANLKAE